MQDIHIYYAGEKEFKSLSVTLCSPPFHITSPPLGLAFWIEGEENFFPAFLKIRNLIKPLHARTSSYIYFMYTRIQRRYRPPSRKFKLITHCKITEIDLPPPSSDKHNILDPRKFIYSVRDVHKRLTSSLRHADTFKTFIATTFSHKYAHWFIAHNS